MKNRLKFFLPAAILIALSDGYAQEEYAKTPCSVSVNKEHFINCSDVWDEIIEYTPIGELCNLRLVSAGFEECINTMIQNALYTEDNTFFEKQFSGKVYLGCSLSEHIAARVLCSLNPRYSVLSILRKGMTENDFHKILFHQAANLNNEQFIDSYAHSVLNNSASIDHLTDQELSDKFRIFAEKGNEFSKKRLAFFTAKNTCVFTHEYTPFMKRTHPFPLWVQADFIYGLEKGTYGLTQNVASIRLFANLGWKAARVQVADCLAHGKCGIAQDPDQLMELAKQGWVQAQQYVTDGLLNGEFGFTKDLDRLIDLVDERWQVDQTAIVIGLASGKNGFTQDPGRLMKLAEKGWIEARHHVISGLADGKNGFVQDPKKLMELAEKGWTQARYSVISGLADGKNGFVQDPKKLMELAEQGWTQARSHVISGLADGKNGFVQDPKKLMEFAEQGWTQARYIVISGLADGKNGFVQDPKKIMELAEKRWTLARYVVISGLADGKNGFVQDPKKIMELVKQGWANDHPRLVEGLIYGKYGFTKDLDQVMELAKKGWGDAQRSVLNKNLPDAIELANYLGCRSNVQEYQSDTEEE